MIRHIRRWLAPRTHRVVAGKYRGAMWACLLCPATGWESNGPQAYARVERHLADAHGIENAS